MKQLIILLFSSCLLFSCKKDDSNTAPQTPIPMNEYFPLSIGNYWVYEYTTRMPDGTILGNPSIDTLKVIGDTLIQEVSYFQLSTNKPINNTLFFRRDSLGFILNKEGSIVVYPSGKEGVFNFHYGFLDSNNQDTVYSYWEEFQDGYSLITSIGNYSNCLANLSKHQAWPDYGGNLSVDTNYFSTIGPVQRSYSYLSGAQSVGRIIDYHLE